MNWEDTIIESAASDTGMRRSNNQDSFAIVRAKTAEAWKRRGHLFLVADGMGAHAVGELASKMACENIPHNYSKSKVADAAEALVKAYQEVGAQIHSKASANRDFEGMGTTCTSLILLPEGALIGHVGDSRAYRIREGRIDQLSFDHSLVWELVRHKHLSLEKASKAVPRNVITRSLGPDPTVEVDLEGPLPIEVGDVYVLCSDGLAGPVLDPEIGALACNFHPDDASRYLISLANLRGGLDNITTIVVRIGEWHDPRSGPANDGAEQAKSSGRGFRLSRLLPGLSRKSTAAPVEEHIYQTADCPIGGTLLKRLSEDVRHAKAIAIEQTWGVDWAVLANLQRETEQAAAEKDYHATLRCLGESIALLGQAGRVHRSKQREANSAI